jgi:hypothetical protein
VRASAASPRDVVERTALWPIRSTVAISASTSMRRARRPQRCTTRAGNVAGVSDSGFPATGAARVHVLQAGYARETGGVEHVGSTVTLILDGNAVIVVDPGMVPTRAQLLAALTGRCCGPAGSGFSGLPR